MLDCRMVTRSLTVRLHPGLVSRVQIDGSDPSIRRLEERQATGARDELPCSVDVTQVGAIDALAGNQVRRKCAGHRRYIKDARFRIERSAVPVCAAHRTG